MRLYALALLLIGVMTLRNAQAQTSSSPFIPSPVAVALSVGQWLINDSRKIYFVQVKATAATPALAREEGFRLAVSKAVGTLVLTESEIKDNELIRKDITQYSSGYVEDFRVIQENKIDDLVQVVMDVWVSDSKIADRLLYLSKGEGELDGVKASTQYLTILNEKVSGDKLLASVLNDFPSRAFDVTVGQTKWRMAGRALEIYIPISIDWNDVYLTALYDVLVATREGSDSLGHRYGEHYSSVVMIKRKNKFFKTYAAYSDSLKFDAITKAIIFSEPMVAIQIKDVGSENIYSQCLKLEHMRGGYYGDSTIFGHYGADKFEIPQGQFFAISPPDASVGIYGDFKLSKDIRLVIEGHSSFIEQMKTVEVRIVKNDQCK